MAGPTWRDASGTLLTLPFGPGTAYGALAQGANVLIKAAKGQPQRVTVLGYRLQVGNGASGVVTLTFQDTDGNPVTMSWDFAAREGIVVDAPAGTFEFQCPQ